jgi:hypothetical protein
MDVDEGILHLKQGMLMKERKLKSEYVRRKYNKQSKA